MREYSKQVHGTNGFGLNRIPVTVVISTKNEEVAIARCIESVLDFSQVIVVDSNSSDRTKDVARSFPVEVVNFNWDGNYPKKKQWCLDNLRFDNSWVLFLDGDERPTNSLRELLFRVNELDAVAVDVGLDFHFFGKRLRYGHKVTKRAVVKVGYASFPVFDDLDAPGMGELEGHYQPEVDRSTIYLPRGIVHDDPDPYRTWIDRHNKYSDWEAHLRARPTTRLAIRNRRSKQGQLFDAIPAKPVAFFFYCYLARLGFLDGRAGFRYALSLSWYYWVIDVKVSELANSSGRTQ